MTDTPPSADPETAAPAAEPDPPNNDAPTDAVVAVAPRSAKVARLKRLVPKTSALVPRGDPEDHQALHATVMRAVAGAGAGAVLADGLAWLLGTGLWQSPLLTFGVMGGALAAVSFRKKKWWRGLLGGAAGLAGAGLFSLAAPLWPPFAAALLGIAAAPVLAEGESPRRKAVTAALAAAASAAGLFVARVMLGWEVFDGVVPSLLGHGAAGATAGLFVGLAAVPRHLGRAPDPVETAYQPALALKDGEVHQILERTIQIHRSLTSDLALRAEGESLERVITREQDLVLRILHIADECRRIEQDLAATPAQEIEDRVADLSRRADAAHDEAAQETYLQTVRSLKGQLEALSRIERGRDRVVARLHATVALLEKLRFALIHLRSAQAQKVGDELSEVTEALDALTDEIEATSSAVSEVYGGDLGEPAADILSLPTRTGT